MMFIAFLSCLLLVTIHITEAFRMTPSGMISTTGKALSLKSSRSPMRLNEKNKVDGVEIDGPMQPLFSNLLVKVKVATDRTAGGLYLPDSSKEKPTEGKVVAVGPGKHHPETGHKLDMNVKVGDHVVYGKYHGFELKYNNELHQIISDDDIIFSYASEQPVLDSIVPFSDYVLIRLPSEGQEKSESGIILSTGNQEKRPRHGVVIKVGKGKQASNGVYIPIPLKAGDGIRFREYSAEYRLKLNNVHYTFARASDALARWDNGEASLSTMK